MGAGGEASSGGGMTEIMNSTSELWMVAGRKEVEAKRPATKSWAGNLTQCAAHW